MAAVNSAMRLNLAAASDPGNFEPKEKARAAAYMAALQQVDPRPLSLGEVIEQAAGRFTAPKWW